MFETVFLDIDTVKIPISKKKLLTSDLFGFKIDINSNKEKSLFNLLNNSYKHYKRKFKKLVLQM